MNRNTDAAPTPTPNEDALQAEIWDDESPAPATEREVAGGGEPRKGIGRGWRDAVTYYAKWLMLNMFGPAQQDDEHDPIVALKRQYHRPTSR